MNILYPTLIKNLSSQIKREYITTRLIWWAGAACSTSILLVILIANPILFGCILLLILAAQTFITSYWRMLVTIDNSGVEKILFEMTASVLITHMISLSFFLKDTSGEIVGKEYISRKWFTTTHYILIDDEKYDIGSLNNRLLLCMKFPHVIFPNEETISKIVSDIT